MMFERFAGLRPVWRLNVFPPQLTLFELGQYPDFLHVLVDGLVELYAHSAKPEFIYRHQWQPHDLVFWDNRSLIHLATGCPAHLRRKLYRTTIQGDAPF